jgi:hypothetical protein
LRPGRQSLLTVHVFDPQLIETPESEAAALIGTAQERLRKSHLVPLWRRLKPGERIRAEVDLPKDQFDLGPIETERWRAPQVSFVVPITPSASARLGTCTARVRVRSLDADEQLAAFGLELRVARGVESAAAFVVGLAGAGCATATAIGAVPVKVGIAISVFCLAGSGILLLQDHNRIGKLLPISDLTRVFVSYAHADQAQVLPAVARLRAHGYYPWIDIEQLQPGERWSERIVQAIDQVDRFFIFWSRAAEVSDEVEKEWRHALERVRREPNQRSFITPVLLDDSHPGPGHPLSEFQFMERSLF